MDDYISKPVRLKEMERALKLWVEKSSGNGTHKVFWWESEPRSGGRHAV